MEVTGAQIRAARGLLGWKHNDLSTRAKVSVQTIIRLEQGKSSGHHFTISAIVSAFADAGVEFIEGGARWSAAGKLSGDTA